jgi:hypothetical protein
MLQSPLTVFACEFFPTNDIARSYRGQILIMYIWNICVVEKPRVIHADEPKFPNFIP